MAQEVDSILRGIALAISPECFASNHDRMQNEVCLFSQTDSFALLDVVLYNNNASISSKNNGKMTLNCEPHYDPGLLSLSIFSTSPGLELLGFKGGKEEWIAPPLDPDVGVVWAGHLASLLSNSRIKPGNHRVVVGEAPRLTCWVEACSLDQVKHILVEETEAEESVAKKSWTVSVMNVMEKTIEYVVDAASFTKAKLLAGRKLEEDTGLAMSKPLYDPKKY